MREAYRVFAASARIGDRWSDQGNVLAEVLYPCLSLRDTMEQQTAEPQRTFMALVSRSREQLALDSLKHTRESVRLMVIRGGEPGHQDTAALGVQGRVTLGHEADSSDHSAFCTAVLCLSENEDCYTREFLRAVHGGRCVIAAEDCGAAAEVLRHDAEAMIVPPRPEAIAAAMDRVAQDGAFARARATAALNAMQKLDIGPEHTVARLLS
jgi:glycosyltransferase involved in cell wall biosynthesis